MNMSVADGELAVLESQTLSQYEAGTRFAASRKGKGFFSGLADILRILSELPERQAVLVKLIEMSEQQLADLGLKRSDFPRVFDADFDPRIALAAQIKR